MIHALCSMGSSRPFRAVVPGTCSSSNRRCAKSSNIMASIKVSSTNRTFKKNEERDFALAR